MFYLFCLFSFFACVIAVIKTSRVSAGCLLLAALVFVGLFVYTCVDMQRKEEYKKEWNRKFEERLRLEDSIWAEYGKTLPENYRERQKYLKEGKDSVDREIRDSELRRVRLMYDNI